MFTSRYFDALYCKSYEDTLDDLEKALIHVNEDRKEGNAYENIRRYTLLSNLVRKYHQGCSLFFSENEYRDNKYEDYGKDDGVIAKQLDNLYSNLEKDGFQNNLTNTFLTLTDPKNKFRTTRFTITTIPEGDGECAICKNPIIQYTDAEVELPCKHIFNLDCLYQHMLEIQQCPVCHIFVHLDENSKILNPYSNNYPEADLSLIRYTRDESARILPHAPERTNRRKIAVLDLRLDKKNFVLATDSYVLYPKDQCLYYWLGNGRLAACAVHPDLQDVLLTPF
jgi:hypothetical protein